MSGFFNIIYETELPTDLITIELLYNLVMICHISGVLFSYVLLDCLIIFIPWLILEAIYADDVFTVAGSAIFVVCFLLLTTFTLDYKERHQRIISNLNTIAKKEIK